MFCLKNWKIYPDEPSNRGFEQVRFGHGAWMLAACAFYCSPVHLDQQSILQFQEYGITTAGGLLSRSLISMGHIEIQYHTNKYPVIATISNTKHYRLLKVKLLQSFCCKPSKHILYTMFS